MSDLIITPIYRSWIPISHLEIQTIATLIIPKWKLADNDKSQIAEEETGDLVNLSGKRQEPMLKWDLDQNRASDRHHPTISLVHVQTDRSFRHVSSLLFLTFTEFFSRLCIHRYLSLFLSLSNKQIVNLHTRHTFLSCYVTQGWSRKRKKQESGGVCEIVNCSSDFRM